MAGIGIPSLPGEWAEQGLCIGLTDMFFPARGEDVRAAQAVCADCPVKAECLEHALVNNEPYGIWGGTSERQRRAMRRDRGITAARPPKPIKHGEHWSYSRCARENGTACVLCREAHTRWTGTREQRVA